MDDQSNPYLLKEDTDPKGKLLPDGFIVLCKHCRNLLTYHESGSLKEAEFYIRSLGWGRFPGWGWICPECVRKYQRVHKTYTAWELCGDWWWIEEGYSCKILGGSTIYAQAVASKNQAKVRLSRLAEHEPRQINRYVHPDTKMIIVKFNS